MLENVITVVFMILRIICPMIKTISLFCAMLFLILRFFFGDSMNDWYKKGKWQCIVVRIFGFLAIIGMVCFISDVIAGKVV